MKKEECMAKIQKMLEEEDTMDGFNKQCEKILDSDVGKAMLEEEEKDSFSLPKIVSAIVYKKLSKDYTPFSDEYYEKMERLAEANK